MANIEAKDLVPGKVYATLDRNELFRVKSLRKRLQNVTIYYVVGEHIELPICSHIAGTTVHQSHKFQEADEMVLLKALKAKEFAEATIQAILTQLPTTNQPTNQ